MKADSASHLIRQPVNFEFFLSKSLNIKPNYRGYVLNTFFVCITLSYNDTFQPKRIGNIAISMSFDDNLERLQVVLLLFVEIRFGVTNPFHRIVNAVPTTLVRVR